MTGYALALVFGFFVGWLSFTASGQHVARWAFDQTLGRLIGRLVR